MLKLSYTSKASFKKMGPEKTKLKIDPCLMGGLESVLKLLIYNLAKDFGLASPWLLASLVFECLSKGDRKMKHGY